MILMGFVYFFALNLQKSLNYDSFQRKTSKSHFGF